MNLERFVTPRVMIALIVIGFAALLGMLMISDAVNDPYTVREIIETPKAIQPAFIPEYQINPDLQPIPTLTYIEVENAAS